MYRRHEKRTPTGLRGAQKEKISPRKPAVAFAQKEEAYSLLFEQNPLPMWVFDRRTLAFLCVNQAAIEHYGYSREEFLQMTIRDIHPAEEVPRLPEYLARTDQLGEGHPASVRSEWKHRRKDGTVFDAEVIWSRITGFQGREARLVMVQDISPRKQTETASQTSDRLAEERISELQTLYQQAPIGLCFLDRDLRYVKINECLARMNGRPAAEHIGRSFREMVPWLVDTLEPVLRRVVENGEPIENVQFGGRVSADSQHLRHYVASYHPVKDSHGITLGINVTVMEITEWKQMQEQLQARLRQEAAVAHLGHLALTGGDERALMDEAMVVVTQTLGIELCNVLELLPGGREMLLRAGIGWKPGKVGEAHVGTGRESQAGYTLTSDAPVISDDLHVEQRFEVLHFLQEHGVQSSITVVIGGTPGGHPFGVLGACSTELRKFTPDDVNFLQSVANILAAAIERKHVESALAESEGRFRELTNAMPQIVWTTRPDGQPEYFNQRWFDYTGLSKEESLSLTPGRRQQIIHPDDLPSVWQRWSDSVQSGALYEAECRFRNRKSGSYRWRLIRAIPVKDPAGRILRWFGTSTDVDDQKRAADALGKAREQLRDYAEHLERRVDERTATLRESVRSLQGVLYHVAHDLRAPLRAIQGLTTLLVEEYAPHFDADGRKYAQRIIDAASRMDVLIRDLLAYGRLGHVNVRAQRLELERLLDSILTQLSFDIEAKGAVVQVARPLAAVRANESVLRQILINLMTNALLYVSPGVAPRIQIWSETDEDNVRLFIQDNGIGIDPEHYERIFKVFEQLHPAEECPGTGIGLAIVIKGAERMGGRVGVESQPGKGSRFWLELPANV
jgi:PAS domain S-box-containing protein